MGSVETVRGPVEADRLGVTLMHEHIFVVDAELLQNYPEEWGSEKARVADATTRLNELKTAGVDTIVDLTVTGLGRYIPRIQRIAAATSVNIVVATGIYAYADLPLALRYRGPGTDWGGPPRASINGCRSAGCLRCCRAGTICTSRAMCCPRCASAASPGSRSTP